MTRFTRLLAFRIFPAFWAITLIVIPELSEVALSLAVAHGWAATLALYFYALVLVLLAAFPDRFRYGHRIGAPLAVFALGGRAGGFIELAIERGSWSLLPAIMERLGIAISMVLWHQAAEMWAVRRKLSASGGEIERVSGG